MATPYAGISSLPSVTAQADTHSALCPQPADPRPGHRAHLPWKNIWRSQTQSFNESAKGQLIMGSHHPEASLAEPGKGQTGAPDGDHCHPCDHQRPALPSGAFKICSS